MRFQTISFLLLCVILLIIYFDNSKQNIEHFSNYKSQCGHYPNLLLQVMNNRNMHEDNDNYDIYIPCSYNDCEKEVLEFEGYNNKKIFLIDGCDWIASKLALWELLKEYYREDASKFMPTTFLLEYDRDKEKFRDHYNSNLKKNPNQMYVLKNYAQRQEGIKLTRDYNEVVNGLNNGWYLVQDYIYNPYLIDKRKINFRYYMLIVCRNGNIESYIHSDGFVYYTPKYYDANDMDFEKHITTGYIDRSVYDHNPLTLEDFRIHLDGKGHNLRSKWDESVKKLLGGVMIAISNKICKNKKLDDNVRFQLFGCDVAPDAELGCSLMEINKGPDLDAKDERDKQVKLRVQSDIFKIVDPINNDSLKETRFIKIL